MRKKGFTLIELLVVIAVLGVLAAGVFTAINPLKRIRQANDARIKNDIGQLIQALQAYYTFNNGTYPAALTDLVGSGDIKIIPNPPVAGSYSTNYTQSSGKAALWFPIQDVASGTSSVWCWSSETNKVTQLLGTTCTTQGSAGTNNNSPTGNFEAATCTTLSGWTCDLDLGTASIGVSFYDEANNAIGSTIANIDRSGDSGMVSICANSPLHQFTYNVTLHGAHTIKAMVDNIDSLGNVVGQSQIQSGSPRATNPMNCP